MAKQTVAVIFGSRSAEHDISIVTAIGSVIKPLHVSGKYNVLPVYISKDASWYAGPEFGDIDLFSSGQIENIIARKKPVRILIDEGLKLVEAGWRPQEWDVDVVFPATHGTYGEDGSLQGLLRMVNVPYVGCGMRASVIAMDKILTKKILESYGLTSVKWLHFTKAMFVDSPTAVIKAANTLKYPVYVKPPRLGSSIGITRVEKKTDLGQALEVALYFDDRVLVEEAVEDLIEVTVPIMGNHEPRAAMVEEILPKNEAFFDFESKYMRQGKKKGDKANGTGPTRIPAKLPKPLYSRCESMALDAYRSIGASGTARIDLLIDKKTDRVYVNEINPLPGFLYAHNWKIAGVSNVELVEELIKLGFERFHESQQLTTTFSTNYLKQF